MTKRHFTLRSGCGLGVMLFHLLTNLPASAQETALKPNAAKQGAEKASAEKSNVELRSSFSILAWNIEAGGSDVATIKQELQALEPFDILSLSEVSQAAAAEFASRWSDASHLIGSSGGDARLLIAWNPDRFEKLAVEELKQIGGKGFAPGLQAAPLAVHLKDKASGLEFKIVMNHLARGSAELRGTQAQLLCDWAREEKLPIVAVGGYNFDYDFVKREGNPAFQLFLASGAWKWIEPRQLVDTNWADRNRDGKDDYPDSMLDFVFVAGPAKQWQVTSEVIVRPGDFPDSDKTSDQRPIRTIVNLPR